MTYVASVLAAAALAVPMVVPASSAAKSCSRGYVHAVIGGKQKCLHAGEFCARRYQRQYLDYHFTCDYYVHGRWHLEHT